MKKVVLLFFAGVLLLNCNQPQRYTQDSNEINAVKAIVNAYDNKDWETLTSHYADSSKSVFNKTKMMSKDIPDYHKRNDANYSERGFIEDDKEFEMVLDDEGKTWVNFWGTWQATMAANGKKITIPIHLTSRFVDGKIVEEYGYWDPTEIVLILQEEEAKSKLPAEEQTILANIDTFVKEYLNKQDSSVLDNVMAEDYKRYVNDEVSANSSEELIANLEPFFKGFSDFHITLLNTSTITDNALFVHWKMTGTHDGEFAGTPATGKKVAVNGLSRLKFNGEGKMEREHVYFDQLSLMQQIGKTLN